ncbi:MAG: glycosyltransferase [Xanthomonadales bacterium]|jgi:glycosyltransferase involved in cell wall biosynthesis|nr:glycosyltransferase [Xanthomonadales bacterium]
MSAPSLSAASQHGTFTASEPIRLCKVVTGFFTGGTELQVLNLARGLDRQRFDLSFACLDRDGDHLAAYEALGAPIEEYRIRQLYHPHTFRQQLRFAAALRKQRVQVVHSYNFYSNVFAIPAARMARVPVVLASIRDRGVYLTPAQKKLQRHVCGLADEVLVNADSIRDWLMEQGLDGRSVTVIKNGIDMSRYPENPPRNGVRQSLGIPESATIVLLMARLNPQKGIDDFIRAAAQVAPRFPDACFLVVGASLISERGVICEQQAYRDELRRLTESLGIADRIIFAGLRDDTPDILAETSLSVLPSHSEGLSNTLLESMAAGIPTIATDVGGNPELVKHGENGLLVPVQAPEALGEAMHTLLGDRELRERMGKQARNRARQMHAFPAVVDCTETLYRTRLQRARRSVAWR